MKKKGILILATAIIMTIGFVAMTGCGKEKEEPKKEGATLIEKTATASGVTATYPDGYYGKIESAYTGDIIIIYKSDKKVLEDALAGKSDSREIDRIIITPYNLEDTPTYAGPKSSPVDYEKMKSGFTTYWANISGTTPAVEVVIGDKTYVSTTTSKDGVMSNIMATVQDGYLVEVTIVGPAFKDSKEAETVVKDLKFDLQNFYNEKK